MIIVPSSFLATRMPVIIVSYLEQGLFSKLLEGRPTLRHMNVQKQEQCKQEQCNNIFALVSDQDRLHEELGPSCSALQCSGLCP